MSTLGMIIGWAVFGVVAGLIARALHPGRDPMGLFGTMLLGVVGSFLGGGLAYMLKLGTDPYQPGGWIMSIVGAIILLVIGHASTRTRTMP